MMDGLLGASLATAGSMFVWLALELSLLFLLISFGVALLQHRLPPARVQALLGGRHGGGYLRAAALGALTPFCSCSTIPLLNGLLRAGAGFGPTMTFLLVSPLLNPVVLGLLWLTFGWQVALLYTAATLPLALLAGRLLAHWRFGRFVKQRAPRAAGCCPAPMRSLPMVEATGCVPAAKYIPAWPWRQLWRDTWGQFCTVMPYLGLGVAIGAISYGFLPASWLAAHTGDDNALAVPLAAVAGIPLYLRAETLIPLASALSLKGMGLGALMALIIGGAGASLTELILLKALFRTPILVAFVLIVLGVAITAGYTFNALAPWLA